MAQNNDSIYIAYKKLNEAHR